MEDSRKGKRGGKKGLPTPDPYVDGENGKKVIVYNTKKGKEQGEKKRRQEKERERKREKGKN